MTKTLVTVCIPVCHEKEFLIGSIREIKKQRHPEIDYEIIICDQMAGEMSKEINELYVDDKEIKIVKIPRIDAGFPLDVGCRLAKGKYFCSLDADAFPISKLWLYLPVKLIEKFGFSFIGKQTGLHMHPLYKKKLGEFFHLNNYFRISTTATARQISEDIGFIKPQNQAKGGQYKHVDFGRISYKINKNIDCDNGVVAQWYSDHKELGPKLSLSMNKILGTTEVAGVYGMVIEDLVFHMVFGQTREEHASCNQSLGEGYEAINAEISEKGLTEEIVKKILNLTIPKEPDRIELYDPFTAQEGPHQRMLQFSDLAHDKKILQFIQHLKNNS